MLTQIYLTFCFIRVRILAVISTTIFIILKSLNFNFFKWTGMQNQGQDNDATSRLCESTPNSTPGNDPLTATSSVEHEVSSAVHSSESSTEESESRTGSSQDTTEPTETERIEHEADITVVNEDESRDSFSRNFESSSSDESENIDPISGSKSDPSDQSETEQDDQNSDQSDEDYTES